MSGRIRAGAAVARWSLLTTQRRALNRMWDAVGRAAGYCMADTWRQDAASYAPGRRNWRCWVLRSKHAGPHRTGPYVWRDGQPPVYDPIPGGHHAPVPGQAPRWIRARHYNVGTRRRDRLAVRHAFEVLQARSQQSDLLGRVLDPAVLDRLADEVLTPGELGRVPFTRPAGGVVGSGRVTTTRLYDGDTWTWQPDGHGGWITRPRQESADRYDCTCSWLDASSGMTGLVEQVPGLRDRACPIHGDDSTKDGAQ